jgi:phosphatidylserine/phosphatidylglycerophosphate/cardiolipin synthase-like enzyme
VSQQAPSRALRWAFLLLVAAIAIAAVAYVRLGGRPLVPGPAPQAPQAAAWEAAFTSPVIPDDPAKHSDGLDARLVALMDRAAQTLDVAVYDFDLENVAEAMARAARRGTRVRMVTDTSTLDNTDDTKVQTAFRTVAEAGIPIVPDERQPIMHHKFTVVDGEWVATGSWNYTDGDTYRLNNNLAVFRSRELAESFTVEFEKMFVQRKFGPSKPPGVPRPIVDIDGMRVESRFAPQDRVANRVVERVNQAARKIHFLAFSFTHDGIGQAIIAKGRTGVEVQGVFETTGSNTSFSEFGRMQQAGLEVYQDGNPYVMHHKVILLDDQVTIFGSFNFSDNANRDNDENLLIVESQPFAALFEQEFQRVLAQAKNRPARK